MCGIVGYIGNRKATPILINGLLKLEYRGYDSAGIATLEDEDITIIRNKGRVKELKKSKDLDKAQGTIGIAHTRWATHGKPSVVNAHPHIDCHKNFAVVHNGIIENHIELKKFLTDAGYTFVSETVTEVIPNLIDYYYSKEEESNDRLLKAVYRATQDLKGSYALAIISKIEKDTMIIARKDSPLVVGDGEGEKFVASDIPAILEYTNKIFILNDGDLVKITRDNITFFDEDFEKVQRKAEIIEWSSKSTDKGEYESYMLKEIYEQPNAIRETIGTRIVQNDKCDFSDINITKEFLESVSHIYIVACGTAMHAGVAVKPIIERLTNI